jgi:hypothetical protein
MMIMLQILLDHVTDPFGLKSPLLLTSGPIHNAYQFLSFLFVMPSARNDCVGFQTLLGPSSLRGTPARGTAS